MSRHAGWEEWVPPLGFTVALVPATRSVGRDPPVQDAPPQVEARNRPRAAQAWNSSRSARSDDPESSIITTAAGNDVQGTELFTGGTAAAHLPGRRGL